ncbi:MAG: hypothetical protein HXK95_000895 [Candidatus Nanogingivalaceae bacterium]|nr:MAG: hypothetical protein HXK94_000890 [Candidatus Nanogingivalaceae bacterium]QWB91754.1 MAG: hypothetical protein HXK95_000895 [Candidatus Nanogingivalaceae bacterium]
MAKVVYVYTKPNCVQCRMVKRYLDNKKIPFIEINIENDEDVINFLKGQGISSAPAIFYGETDKNNGLLLENATNFTGNNQNELKKLVEFFE